MVKTKGTEKTFHLSLKAFSIDPAGTMTLAIHSQPLSLSLSLSTSILTSVSR